MRSVTLLILSVLFFSAARSQLCTGSLGDPVAFISFGSGPGSQGPALSGGNTNYTFSPGCPNDGSYNITNLSFGCFGSSWHTLVGDHTPNDVGGFFMLVNASAAPGIFYTDTVTNLCGNTIYEFSSFIMNVMKPTACNGTGIQPDLTFTIETLAGTPLITYNTNNIPPTDQPEWKQYGTFLTTPSGVAAVVIKIVNNAPGGCGNDLAIDDIQFRPCGPKLDAGIDGFTKTDTSFCEGDTRTFILRAQYSAGYTNPRLQWQVSDETENWLDIPGATTTTYIRTATNRGTYRYRLLIAEGNNIFTSCRIASKPISFIVTPPAFVQATNYVFGCLGSPVPFAASGANKFEWTGPNGFTSNIRDPVLKSVQFRDSGLYIVKGTTFNGCVGYDSTYLQVFLNAKVSVTSPVSTCEGIPVTLNSSGGYKIKWDPSQGLNNDTIANPVVANPRENTSYKIIVFNQFGCFDTATVRVNVLRLPKADAGPDLKMLKGRPIRLKSSVSGSDIAFTWSPVTDMLNSASVTPSVNPPVDTRYRLTVTSNAGCGTISDEMQISVLEKIKVPNTFTPNGDGYNDVWQIDLLDLFENSLIEVYNTGGQLVHRNVGYTSPWDGTRNGKPVVAGTYYYVIDLKANADKLTGYVTIIR